ncbi:MAG: hypothetical protein KC656_29170, partial [Myxococcales bacterium]|nr:hypothetical protein [Myxococcales bacterium]
MTRVVAAWDRFWHSPTDPRVAAFLRIALGSLVFLQFALQAPYVLDWWGEDGLLPQRAARRILDQDASSLLLVLPPVDAVVWTAW